MTYPISPSLRSVLRELEMLRRSREKEYNEQDGVASTDPANMRAPWAEATPSVQGVRHSGSRQNG
jgi:hypothetical protein